MSQGLLTLSFISVFLVISLIVGFITWVCNTTQGDNDKSIAWVTSNCIAGLAITIILFEKFGGSL